jgi:Dyp-type peroxidase family
VRYDMGAQGTGQQVQTPADERLKDSEEIQGNILAAFNKPLQQFLFLNFRQNQAGARAWLRHLIRDRRVATTRDVAAHNRRYRELRKQYGAQRLRQEPPVSQDWMGVGLTSWGLVTLHPELAADLVAFGAFWRGPLGGGADEHGNWRVPAALVGDEEDSDPSAWVIGGPDQGPVDALVTIAADDEDGLNKRVNAELALAKDCDLVVLEVRQHDGSTTAGQLGQTLPPPDGGSGGIEHFGFMDGISQPSIRGFTSAAFRHGRWESARKPGSPIIATGEFVLGYPGERGSYPRAPRPVTPDWMRDGSFQVFLRLTQDVAGWWDQMDSLGSALSEDIAAKAIGRRRDGTPLAPKGGGDGLNDFDYADDPDGFQTPRFAHIRLANARDPMSESPTHRLLRRGIPFGPFAANQAEAREHDVERGLLLNAFMASIDDQFEFVQRNWLSNPPPSMDGPDPVIGASAHPCILRREGQEPVPLDLRRFVRTTGAVYAFAPSISALRQLGEAEPTRSGGAELA